MRVVQVAPRYPPRTGGVETHVHELATRLARRGHDVTVLTADAGPDVAATETRDGVRVRRHRGVAPGGAFHVAPGLLGTIRRTPADVVHAHNYHSLPLAFAALAHAADAFVATPHYHGGSASSVRNALLAAYRPVGARALGRADAVLAVSDWERERLAADLGVDAAVVPNGLDVPRFAGAEPDPEFGTDYLLCVGRLERYKGVQHAIRALPALPDRELVVAGSGPYGEELAAIAREAGVADRVRFPGYVADERLPGLYAGAAAVLALSSFEAYGMTVAEALASGTPCVVREAGALRDWVDREGCVGVDDPTPAAVADAVTRAVGRTPSTAGLLTWAEVVDRVATRYGSLLSAD